MRISEQLLAFVERITTTALPYSVIAAEVQVIATSALEAEDAHTAFLATTHSDLLTVQKDRDRLTEEVFRLTDECAALKERIAQLTGS